MNIIYFVLFLLAQMVINLVCRMFIPLDSLYGILAYYLVTCLLIAFLFAYVNVPKPYRKDLFSQPAFHKSMLTFFLILFALDIILLFI